MDPDVSERMTWEAWVAWMQASEALLTMGAAEPGESFERLMHHEVRTLKGEHPTSLYNVSTWLEALFLAMSCRDGDRVQALARIPVPVLREWSESEGAVRDEWVWPWAEAVQDFVLQRDSFAENLAEAMRLCEPENLELIEPEEVERLVLPPLRVLDRLAARDADGFNEQMYRGLLGFREHYTSEPDEDESPRRNLEGAVPLSLFGLACVAYDLHQAEPSFEPDLSSTYFPRKILERAWENEFPYRAHIPDPVDPQVLRERFRVDRPADGDAVPMVERHEALPPLRYDLPEMTVDVVEEMVDHVEQEPSRLPSVRLRIRELALASVADDPDSGESMTWSAWASWAQVSDAFLAASRQPAGTTITRSVLAVQRRFGAIEPGPGLDVRTWLEAFYLALTCRLESVVPVLAQIPVRELREAGERNGVVEDEFVYAWARALQSFIVDRRALGQHVGEAMRLASPEHAHQWGAQGLDRLVVPPMKALLRLAEYDTEGFNESLREGLELFREHYTETEERRASLEGVLPLGLFAIACLAYDLRRYPGFSPDLSSTYFPKYILNRQWEGEFRI
ncbi:immunity 49 family protein [Nocardiopsis xinjiangensis]|uniref:immunity 49 family protein n=1 Tax=Nocardiopsis xinjiangensis TaxID=124285 RepID=UPI001F4D29F0|nr:immunity 49 family protein [Nocardiopsis xinjiangensis]